MTSEGSQKRGPALVFINAESVRPEGGAVSILDRSAAKRLRRRPYGSAPAPTPQIALEQISWIAVLCSASPAIRRLKGSMDAATATLVPILLLEDLDMGRISTFFRQFSRAFDHFLTALERRSGRLFSRRRFARHIDSARAYLKKRLPQWQSKLSSLVSKVGAKTSTSSR
jgi:hypothetical protein